MTSLYEWLSRNDELQGESNSIINQKTFLIDDIYKSALEKFAQLKLGKL